MITINQALFRVFNGKIAFDIQLNTAIDLYDILFTDIETELATFGPSSEPEVQELVVGSSLTNGLYSSRVYFETVDDLLNLVDVEVIGPDGVAMGVNSCSTMWKIANELLTSLRGVQVVLPEIFIPTTIAVVDYSILAYSDEIHDCIYGVPGVLPVRANGSDTARYSSHAYVAEGTEYMNSVDGEISKADQSANTEKSCQEYLNTLTMQ